jgi:hypothetical protein
MTPAQTAAFENSASISRSHALAETMHAHTAADFRLIRTFCHYLVPRFKIASVLIPKLEILDRGANKISG